MFDKFKVKKPQRSTFSLSHKHETTVNIGDINCLHWNWCFPGDRFKIKYSFLCKFAPMIAPNFSRMRIKSEVFYVPLSDLYDHFHDVIMNYKEESSTVRENGREKSVNYTSLPSMMLSRFAFYFEHMPASYIVGSDFYENLKQHTDVQEYAIERLIHQIGIPFDICRKKINSVNNPYCANSEYLDYVDTSVSPNVEHFNPQGSIRVNLAPFQAYQYVYNWYYRDSVRSPEIDCYPDISESPNVLRLVLLSNKSSDELGIYYQDDNVADINTFFNSLFQVRRRFYRKDYFNTAVGDPTVGVDSIQVPDNIVDLRKANQLQKFIEKQALAGNRIAEFIMSHWAYKSDDYELGRPILISSSSQNVQISEVLQTSQTTTGVDDPSAQGTRSGVGNSYGNSNGSYFVAPDYGVLLINMSIVPEISYFSGLPRKLTPYRWEHFPWPEFAQIGMQPIYDFELSNSYHVGAWETWGNQALTLENQNVFGYAPRYSEYKMELDQVSGEMATSLRYWHQSPHMEFKQQLNENFGLIGMVDYNMTSYVNLRQYYNQIFAVQSDNLGDHCQVIGLFDISVNRALPYNDMPAL